MCTLGCGARLTGQGMPSHLRDKCELRMLTCDYCKEEFKSRDLCAHGEKCPKMNVKCELKCGETIRREDVKLHQNYECSMAEDTCKLDCGLKMRRNKLKIHMRDSCINRKATKVEIHEQRNLCRVKRTNGKYGGYKKYTLTEVKERDNALSICGVCEGIMREACFDTSSGEQFCSCCEVRDSSSSTTQPYPPFRTYYTPKQTPIPNVPVRNTINLLKCSCPLSERGCTWIGILKECENHLDTCGYVGDKCKLGCGEVLHRNQLIVHKDSCSYRRVKCEHCFMKFKFRDMPKHLRECPKMEVFCELNCGIVMLREDVKQHLEQDCGMMEKTCILGCEMRMTRDELENHVINTCVQREVSCEHCWEDFKFCDMTNHLDKCPKMEVSCELKCGVVMCREDTTHHLETDCVEKEIKCPFVKYKCKVTSIKRKYLSQHLEEKRTEHLELKLTAMEENILKQNEEVKQQNFKINRMTEHINALRSLSSTTMLDWKIENLSKFIQINHVPEPRHVAGYNINIHFLKEYIYVDTGDHYNYRSFSAKFLIRLYSNIRCRVVKEYKINNLVYSCSGKYKTQIARITKSDAEELSRIGSANKLILEMYVTKQ